MPGQQKALTGTVVTNRMDKTVVVLVETTTRHRLYRKIMKRSKRYLAHDDRLDAQPGDLVRILETRPLSRHKRWRVAEVLKRGEVAEIAPREIDSEYLGRPRERETEVPAVPAVEETPVAEAAAEEERPAAVEEPDVTTVDESPAEAPSAEVETEEGEQPAEMEPPAPAPAEEPALAPEAAAEQDDTPEETEER